MGCTAGPSPARFPIEIAMSKPSYKVALNGYGRIGRCVLRALHERHGETNFDIVALNDLADQASIEYLTRFDSTHGRFPGAVSVDGDCLHINGDCVKVLRERTPEAIDWRALEVDLVLECSGAYNTRREAQRFIDAGAPRVLLSQPMASEAVGDSGVHRPRPRYRTAAAGAVRAHPGQGDPRADGQRVVPRHHPADRSRHLHGGDQPDSPWCLGKKPDARPAGLHRTAARQLRLQP